MKPRTFLGMLAAAIVASMMLAAPPPVVPLGLWTGGSYPQGLDFGATMGISFGDYDGDGYVDVFACRSGNLWRNVGGTDWVLATNVSSLLPLTERRYGASFGDYDGDGLPDIAMAPRVPAWGDDLFHLLHAEGAAAFEDVAADPSLMDVQAYGNTETLCWADVNGDGLLDLFVPAYPSWEGGPGNFFYLNEGPTGPGGAYRFTEASAGAGLDNPPGTARPEGAQFVDYDGDGDVDLFANGTLYQNVSSHAAVAFNALDETASGIGLRGSLDEGAVLFDYDMDGDFDLVVAYVNEGVRIWENRGDGTFFAAESSIVDAPMTGLDLGMSAEDWDNDGDIDFTTRGVFRQNRLVEDGTRHFTVEATTIPPDDLSSATPAWGDWDKDGDLDCALGNWAGDGKLYENTTYTATTAAADKKYLRVRPVRDARTVARGLETEYGATVEVRASSGTDPLRRKKFVAASSGYLNQNEYALTFGLPVAGPFDVTVDFPGVAQDGLWRIDKHVNPALGAIDPLSLADREIEITRCGRVVIDGVAHDPLPLAQPALIASVPTLALPAPGQALPPPAASLAADSYAGLEFDTRGATGPLAIREILLDGQLDVAKACGGHTGNILLWDVTAPQMPAVVSSGVVAASTSARNRRTVIPVDIPLAPGHVYRLVARVTETRVTPVASPRSAAGVAVHGGLTYQDQGGCNGQRVGAAPLDPTSIALAFRFVPIDPRTDVVGDSLRVARDPAGTSLLSWDDAPPLGYDVRRCAPASGPCTPQPIGRTAVPSYSDPDVPDPASIYWYAIDPVSACLMQ